ncbi:hypothetical protein FDG2_5935 [Candidatus Protofrankia californiensis]|uniref:Thioredoxin family protein n=1 Tax=Candidatus Protofrankia californiensis TaxID=1839754 RepID=A0A1C3PG29_9ACTN|nr:hypothetical protein FDG2_5935 [Candidatus Protofrankia californiensis]
MTRQRRQIILLTQADCALCDHAKRVLVRVAADHPLAVEEIGLDTPAGRDLAVRHGVLFAPGVLLDGTPFGYGRLSEKKLRKALTRHAPPRTHE